MKTTLVDSGVVFIRDTHQYFLNGKELHGITGMISRQLFPNEYSGVSEDVLKRAAERGTSVHDACEVLDTLGIEQDIPEVRGYRELTSAMQHEATEYIVTDNEYFASPIDKVYRVNENTFDLADIKTSYRLNEKKTAWQLSIYAYLFERQNPTAKVRNIYALHLRDNKSEKVRLDRIEDKEIELLFAKEKAGEVMQPSNTLAECVMPEKVALMQKAIIEKMQLEEQVKNELNEIKSKLLDMMTENGVTSWDGEYLKITRKKGATRTSFDYKKMKSEHPELSAMFSEYDTQTTTKQSLQITIKK